MRVRPCETGLCLELAQVKCIVYVAGFTGSAVVLVATDDGLI